MLKKINIQEAFSKLVSISNFRKLLVFTLTITWSFYLGSMNYSIFSYLNFKNLLENYIILKFIGISLAVTFVFYELPTFLLRLLFHGYIKDKFLKIREELIKEGRFSFLKSMHVIHGVLILVFKDYVYRLGFLTRKDIEREVEITEADKEVFLNEVLGDCYKWICINIHFLLTLIIIWNYINYWLIALLLLIFLFMLASPIGIIFMAMNLDFLNRFRRKILRQKSV